MLFDILMDVTYHLICQGPCCWQARRERLVRKSNKEAAQTREAIVAAAADHIRRTGIAEASLADVMAAAGLTHGGFSRHFRKKEHPLAATFSAPRDKTVATLSRTMSKGGLNPPVDSYLA